MEVIGSEIKSLYEDKCMGKLPEAVFQNLLRDFSKEQTELSELMQATQKRLDAMQSTEIGISNWLSLIAGYMEITELDRPTVLELINSIEISEGSGASGHRSQEISIHYRFIGNLLQDAKEDIA